MISSRRAWAVAPLVGAVILLWNADPMQSRLYPPCPLLWLTGLYCPGCGTLRALHNLLRGQIHAAVSFNPLLVACLVLWPAVLARPALLRSSSSGRVIVALVLAYWVMRNVPWHPFLLLAPNGSPPPTLNPVRAIGLGLCSIEACLRPMLAT
jgi:hypothetical protein